MQLIRKQFGASFADALATSPTLVADLSALRAAGVKIRKISGHCQAYSMYKRKSIYIGARCKLSYKLISLAHEKVHVLDKITPDPTPRVTGRKEFIHMCLEAETDAIVHEVVVAEELLNAGLEVDDHCMKWVKLFGKSGRKGIRKAMNNAHASNTGEKYPEYYGGWYDESLKPKDRLPVFDSTHPRQGDHETPDAGDELVMLPGILSLVTAPFPPTRLDGRTLCPRGCC